MFKDKIGGYIAITVGLALFNVAMIDIDARGFGLIVTSIAIFLYGLIQIFISMDDFLDIHNESISKEIEKSTQKVIDQLIHSKKFEQDDDSVKESK